MGLLNQIKQHPKPQPDGRKYGVTHNYKNEKIASDEKPIWAKVRGNHILTYKKIEFFAGIHMNPERSRFQELVATLPEFGWQLEFNQNLTEAVLVYNVTIENPTEEDFLKLPESVRRYYEVAEFKKDVEEEIEEKPQNYEELVNSSEPFPTADVMTVEEKKTEVITQPNLFEEHL